MFYQIKFYCYLLWSIFWRSCFQLLSNPLKTSVQNFRTLKRVVPVPRFRRNHKFDEESAVQVQEFHGGQSWEKLGDRFICDFSVTTSVLGPPRGALRAARHALSLIDHYPEQDAFKARQVVGKFIEWPASQILLGNGASEFIDLVLRGNPGATWRPGPWPCQFMEYERSAKANGLTKVDWENTDADYTVIVNPSSPTGDYVSLKKMEEWIQSTSSVWIVDESFIMCRGPNWRKYSVMDLVEKYPDRIVVIVSWTKVFACPGIRIGSVASTQTVVNNIQSIQVPWSVNIPAQRFIAAAVTDRRYLKKTWFTVPRYRKRFEKLLKRLGLKPNANSPMWVPWIYVDCKRADIAERMTSVALEAGLPVRHCESYGQPTFLRLGIRTPIHQNLLLRAWIRDPVLYGLVQARIKTNKME
ncbi:hypothetical protein GEMRC1_003625 [Eukaryota sp. GEM-RC1]